MCSIIWWTTKYCECVNLWKLSNMVYIQYWLLQFQCHIMKLSWELCQDTRYSQIPWMSAQIISARLPRDRNFQWRFCLALPQYIPEISVLQRNSTVLEKLRVNISNLHYQPISVPWSQLILPVVALLFSSVSYAYISLPRIKQGPDTSSALRAR